MLDAPAPSSGRGGTAAGRPPRRAPPAALNRLWNQIVQAFRHTYRMWRCALSQGDQRILDTRWLYDITPGQSMKCTCIMVGMVHAAGDGADQMVPYSLP